MNRNTSGGFVVKGMPKRRVTFVVEVSTCNPDIFAEDFELTIEALSSETELRACRKAAGDPTSLAMMFAFYSMHSVNGDPLNDAEGEREYLWEALGPARQIVMGIYARSCMVDGDSQGKALSSLRVD